MAISYVGGKGTGLAGSVSTTSVDLTTGLMGGSGGAPIEGDLVVVTVSVGTQARQPNIAVSGYTPLTVQRTTSTTYDANVQTCYKFMGASPDTTVTIPASGNIADGLAYAIQVFRGVQLSTPLDVTSTYATNQGTDNIPDPAAIQPVTPSSWIVVCGGGASAAGAVFTASYLTNFVADQGQDTNDAFIGAGYYTGWTSGSYDPAKFGGGNVSANNSWGCTTLALRPKLQIDSFTANKLVTGLTIPVVMVASGAIYFLINESASTPAVDDAGWSASLPTSYTFGSEGSKTLYVWAKGADDSISASISDTYTTYSGSAEYQAMAAQMPGLRYVNNPFLLHDTSTWKGRQAHFTHAIVNPWDSSELLLYFGAGDYKANNYKIGLATAPVSAPFLMTEYGSNPVVSPSGSDKCVVGPDHVHYNAGTNEIWIYTTVFNSTLASSWQGLWKSTPGSATEFTYYGVVLSPSDDEVFLGNAGYITEGTTWYCWYTYRTAGTILPGIRIATSTGGSLGTSWSKEAGDVVTIGDAGEWDSRYIEGMHAFKRGDSFVLFYNASNGTYGVPTTGIWACGCAISDAYNGPFYKDAQNPTFGPGETGQWDDKHMSTAFILFHETKTYFYYQGTRIKTAQNFTADNTNNTLTASDHGLLLNDIIWVSSTGALPTGLSASTNYYVISPTSTTFQLSLNSSGSVINFTTDGTGVLSYGDTGDGYEAALWDLGGAFFFEFPEMKSLIDGFDSPLMQGVLCR